MVVEDEAARDEPEIETNPDQLITSTPLRVDSARSTEPAQ
jgi:hypothetical protein